MGIRPNHLTVMRLIAAPAVMIWAAMQPDSFGPLAVFVAAALTDGLDGWMARRYAMATRLGAALDSIADKALIILTLLALATTPIGANPVFARFLVTDQKPEMFQRVRQTKRRRPGQPQFLRQHAKGDRVGYLTEDTPTKRKEMEHHRKLFGIEYDEVYLVRTFDEWKSSFRAAQKEVDMLVLLGVAAVEDWSDEEAARFAQEQTRIPTGTDFGWLMHISMFGVGKSPAEQGEWAAKAALKILDGASPSQIPLTYNTRGELFFNKTIASRIGLSEPPALAKVVE